ncbi:carbamoyltransferase [Mycobacterium sp. 852013-51886_SCH5428379]|uniref:carbamoyltransferase family protein n=1 Tax=Mycobacterium sp. 852013-51886_SCH5428379 TaxID=1834111 RepID=UPI0007FEA281|nr:carbamoyltransferase C-terminal domain-containing protein [Mycobacterium sp. 852013-51886_SCH5428379]OBB59063.1 carbamoyltransferase [Mycobacterium sp. 852013-51886_SCH5428379]
MRILGINAVFHDPAAALVVDGQIVAAAEEERFSRRKHGKQAVPFSTWELPVQAARWCLEQAGLTPADLDAVGYSYDPRLMDATTEGMAGLDRDWEYLRTLYAERAPRFLQSSLPGLDPGIVRHVRHHVAHAASTGLASPRPDCAVLTVDGRGERTSMLAGTYHDHKLDVLATQSLPHSLGLFYEELTEHLGFARSSDEYKVMAMASYGTPRYLDRFRELVYATGDGGFRTEPVDWESFTPKRKAGAGKGHALDRPDPGHADLACSVQAVVEEVLLDLVGWLRGRTDTDSLCLAGGVALNCVANSKIFAGGGFDRVWVQPAAGDSGTALGAALSLAGEAGEPIVPMPSAALGRGWSDDEIESVLREAAVPFERPADFAAAVGDALADDKLIGWFQGRSEFGPRALGNRSLLADPRRIDNLERLNNVKGREQFRPVAPMVLAERAAEIFSGGPIPSPYMLFVHEVAEQWRSRIPAVTHVDNTARIQTVDRAQLPLLHATISRFAQRTGVPVVVNTSFNTAGRPMVDSPRDALECFGSSPIDVLAIGPFLIRRPA